MVLALWVVGLAMTGVSLFFFVRYLKLKNISYFDNFTTKNQFPFTIVDGEKLYSICFIGGKFVDITSGFKIVIVDKDGGVIVPQQTRFKLGFRYKARAGVEAFHFSVPPGDYKLQIDDYSGLKIKETRLFIKELFTESGNSYGLLIKEAMPDRIKLLAFVLFLFGLLILNIAFVYGMYIKIKN